MPRLLLSLLGAFHVELDGQPVSNFESNKVRALLAYLAAEADRPYRREALATLLWPDWPQQSAIRNLRNTLVHLRKNIGDREAQPPFLLITRESVQLNREAEVWVDVAKFEADLKLSQPTISNLKSVISLYHGPFLEGFSLSDSPAFEQWVLARRESLHRQALQALFRLAEAHEQQGELEQALTCARRQVELEPWHEPGQQQLMRLLALSGQRTAALAQYEALYQSLADELAVEPSAETKRLAEAIRNENIQGIRERRTGVSPAPYPISPAVLPPAPGEPPFKGLQYFDTSDADLFFGREALTARLVRHIREMVEASASVGATRSLLDETTAGADIIPDQARFGIDGSPLQVGDSDGSPVQEGCCFLAVVGASGSGKSSVVRAGVVPALLSGKPLADGTLPPEGSPGWHIHVFTPTVHPIEALAVSLTRETGTVSDTAALLDSMARDPRSLHLHAQRLLAPVSPGLTGKCRLLLLVDQFEELFTLCRSETERAAFLDNLLTAVQGGGPTQVIVVLRADFYGHCAQYPLLRQALCARQEYIGPMNAAELRRAIEEPARRNGWEFEPGLVDLFLRDIGACEGHDPEPGALPLLEHALLETWQRRSGKTLTLQGYADAGGVHGAIAKTAESVFARLSMEQQALARRIFLRLTELGEGTQDTRRRALLAELAPKAEDAQQVAGLLQTLADARLITLAEDTAEVAHEALIREWPALRQWLSEDREGLHLHRHLTEAAESWAELERDPGELYRGARLAQAVEWAESHPDDLNSLEREFLQASQAQAEHEAAEREAQRQRELEAAQRLARTQRQRSLVLSIGLAIAVVLIGVALWLNFRANQAQRSARTEADNRATQQSMAEQAKATSQAEAQRRGTAEVQALEQKDLALQNLNKSEAQRLAAEANRLLFEGRDAQRAALLALQSLKLEYTAQGDEALSRAARLNYPLLIFRGHTDAVWGVTFTGDGKKVVTNSTDDTVLLWEANTGKILQTYKGEHGGGYYVDISADGRYVAGKTDVGNVVVWDGITARPILSMTHRMVLTNTEGISMTVAEGMSKPTSNADISSDGRYLLTGHEDGSARIWEIATGKEVQRFTGQTDLVCGAVFSPHDRYVATSDIYYASVRVWEARTGKLLHVLSVNAPCFLAFSSDEKILLALSDQKSACLWDVESGQQIRCMNHETFSQANVAFSPDGRYVLTGTSDGVVHLWDANTGIEVRRYQQSQTINTVAFSPDGQTIAIGSVDGTVNLWATEPRPVQEQFPGAWYSAFSPDWQHLILSINGGASLEMMDLNTRQTHPLNLPAFGSHYSADGRTIISMDYYDIITLDASSEVTRTRFSAPDLIWLVEISPDGKTITAIGAEGGAFLFDATNGELLYEFPGKQYGVNAFSPDSSRLAIAKWRVGTGYGQILVYSLPDMGNVLTLTLPNDQGAYGIAFSPDGKMILGAGGEGENELLLWDARTGEQLQEFTGHNGNLYTAAFSPDGRYVAAAGNDAIAHLWEVATGQEVRRFVGHTGAIGPIGFGGPYFSPDGKWMATQSYDGMKLWLTDLDDLVNAMCEVLPRDLTDVERANYGITDTGPTCPKFAQP